MKRLIIILTVALLLLSGCGQITGKTINNQEITKIGAVIPLTGWGAYYGIPVKKGMQIAQEELNEEVKIIFEDSKGNGKDAVTAVRKLLDADKADVIYTAFAPPALAINPIMKEAKTPFLYDAFITSLLEENEYAFKMNFDAEQGCKQLAQIAKPKFRKIGAIMANTEYNHLCLKGAKEINPNIEAIWYEFGETDFRTLLLKAKNKNFDAIIIVAWEDEFIPLFTQKTELRMDDITILCAAESECIGSKVQKSVPNKALRGTIGVGFKDVLNTKFAKKYKREYPNATQAHIKAAALGYEAIQVIAKASESCSNKDNTKECIRENMNKVTDYTTVYNSNGFKDRILNMEQIPYVFTENGWQEIYSSPR